MAEQVAGKDFVNIWTRSGSCRIRLDWSGKNGRMSN